MTTNHPPTCPDCGTLLPADSPQQLCPACLLQQVFASRTIDGTPATASSPPPSPEEIADKFPQFEITECLGRGGMGVVYKARQKSLNRWVAFKILAPEKINDEKFAERFTREAHTLALLNHPNIVTVYDHGETDGLFYIVMEYVDGVNLRDLLREGKLEDKQALAIVPPICEALQYAHDKGIVHRDIKPENLLLDRDGRVKIADFGIASLVGASGESAGTPPYMAPEQSGASPEVDNRADIYALGVVLYEMLTGERPNKELIAPSKKVHIDVRLDEIVLRALEKTPELRFQTAGEFRTQVETIASTSANFGAKEAQIHKSEIDNHSSDVSSRFSRTAIVGACWALAAVLNYLVPTLGYRMKSEFVPIMMSILGLSAPIGTTILGWIAVWQIRRSAGRLHGLRLAVFDGLLFPLLLLVVAVGFALGLLISELKMGSPKTVQVYALALAISAPFCWLIIRRVWRKVNQPPTSPPGSSGCESAQTEVPAKAESQSFPMSTAAGKSRFSRTAIVGACLGLIHIILLPLVHYTWQGNDFSGNPHPDRPPYAILVYTEWAFFVGALIAMTILGWKAVGQIRRSGGRLHGMWLALFDGLLLPLFVASMAGGLGIHFLLEALNKLLWSITGRDPEFGLSHWIGMILCALILTPLVIWFVRRKVSQPHAGAQNPEQRNPTSIQEPVSETKPTRLGKWAVGLFIAAIVGAPLLGGFMGTQEIIVLCCLALLLSLVFGVMSWRSKPGKFAALASGLGLLLLVAFTSLFLTPRPPRGPYEGGGVTSAYTPVKDNLLAAMSARYGAEESRFELGKPMDLDLLFLNHSPIEMVINPQELPPAAWLTVTNSAGERVELKGTNQAASVLKEPRVVKSRDGTGGYAMTLLLLPKNDTKTAKNAKADAMAWVEPGTYTLQFHLRLPPTSYQPDGLSKDEYRTVPITIELAGTPTNAKANTPSAAFGEVVERELILGEKDVLRGLYLESGNLTSLTADEHSRVKEIEGGHKSGSTTRDWFDSKQLDFAISSWGDNFRIVGAEGRFVLNTLPAEKWETATYTDVSNAVALETIIMARTKRKFEPTLVSSDGHWAFRQIHRNPELPITYAMRSGDKLGLLQITARMVYPPGIRVRYKLLQNDVIDQVVPNIYGRELGDLKCFDFESNRFHSPPKALADELLTAVNREQARKEVWHRVNPELLEWLEKTGVDVVAAAYDSGAELLFIDQSDAGEVALPLKGSLEEIDPLQAPLKLVNRGLPKNVMNLTRTAYLGWPREPRNEFFPFQTREGNRGVLQVTGINDDPGRGVKIRYKLVQSAPPVKPAPKKQYELSIQFGQNPNDPVVKTDVELGTQFGNFKKAGDRLFSINGQIDEPKNGKFPGSITLGDYNLSEAHKGTGHQGTIPVELELGKPFNHTVIVGIGFIRIITLNEKPASSEPIVGPAATDSSDVDGARSEHFEPMKELEIPLQDFPEGGGREGCRLTVAPGAGNYVLATLREYEGAEVIGENTPVKRQVARLLRTQSATHSEDIFLDVHGDDVKMRIAAGSRYGVSGFGQQVVITGLDFDGGSGNSVGGEKQPRFVTRRFKFIDSGGDKARTRIVEFELRVISEDETAAMAKRRGFSLPDENVANWAMTLAEPPDEQVIPDTDAVNDP